jgi:hypothetical protein
MGGATASVPTSYWWMKVKGGPPTSFCPVTEGNVLGFFLNTLALKAQAQEKL